MGIKNRFSILDQMNEESNPVRHREDETNDIVLGGSQVKDLGIEHLNTRKFRTSQSQGNWKKLS